MATYEIILRNQSGFSNIGNRNENNEGGMSVKDLAQTGAKKMSGGSLPGKVGSAINKIGAAAPYAAAFVFLGSLVKSEISYSIQTVSLRTGSNDLQQRVNFQAQVLKDVLSGPTGWIKRIQQTVQAERTIYMQDALENVSRQRNIRRAGVNSSRSFNE